MRLRLLFILTIQIFLLFSCKDEKVNVVDIPELVQPFIDDFVLEGQKRGVEVIIDDLIVQFENDLEIDGVAAAGICRTRGNNTPIILLDTTSANWTLNQSSREQLVFHELGHCFLKRAHINNRMPNNNYRSMMRASGEQLYGPELNAFKRDFYLDELFDQQTIRPDWAERTAYSSHAGLLRTPLLLDDFTDNSNGWTEDNGPNVQRTVSNGVYDFSSSENGFFGTVVNFGLPLNDNFEIEIDMEFQNSNSFAGIVWGGTALSNDNYSYVYLTPDGLVLIGSQQNGFESTTEDFLINLGSDMTITIRHVDGFYYIYVDEIQVDVLSFESLNGMSGGVAVGPGGHVQFDNLHVTKLN